MLVDATARFITQREYPQMSLICIELSASGIIVTAPGVPTALHIDSSARTGETLTATVWDDSVRCEAVSREADDFFSRFLQVDCRLVTTGEGYSRAISKKYAPGSGRTQVGFADGYQFLLIRCPPGSLRTLSPAHGIRHAPPARWKALRIGEFLADRLPRGGMLRCVGNERYT